MDLDNKYELGEVVANDSESKTFRAREVSTGRPVFVHLLFGSKPAGGGESLLSILLGRIVDPAKRGPVLEVSDYNGMPYAVTEVLPDFRGMRSWIERERGVKVTPPAEGDRLTRAGVWRVPPVQPAAASPIAQPPTPANDEFEKLFGALPGQAAPAAPPATPPAIGAEAPKKTPGEFTALFHAAVRDVPPEVVSPAPPSEPRKAATEPGEFTRVFQPSVGAPPAQDTPPAPPASPAAEGGEFTRLFATPAPPAPPPEQTPAIPAVQPGMVAGGQVGDLPHCTQCGSSLDSNARFCFHCGAPVAPAVLPAAPPPAAPGEFTRLFQATPISDAPPPPAIPNPAAPQQSEGEFTRLFRAPDAAPAGPPPAGPPQGAPAGAGEFTQLFRAPQEPPAMPAPTQPPAGEFTRMFQSPTPVQAGSLPKQPQGSEFTRLFGAPGGAPAAPPPPTTTARGATGVFSPPPTPSTPAPQGPVAAAGPSEYTRLFGAAPAAYTPGAMPPTAAAPAPAPAPPAAAAAPTHKPASALPVIIIVGVVVLAALAVIVYFMLRK